MKKQLAKFVLFTTAFTVGTLGFVNTAAADYRNTSYKQNSDYVMADVVRSEPIYKTVTVSRPERVCEEVEVYDRRDRYNRRARHHHHDDTAGGTIAGGVIGGVLGRQIGKGSGRDAATIAGVLIGSAIGHDNAAKNKRSNHRSDHRRDDNYRVRTEQRCHVNTERFTEERMDGYRVTYFLNGQEYQTRTRRKP